MIWPLSLDQRALLLALAVSAGLILIAHRSRRWTRYPACASDLLASRWMPFVMGALTTIVVRVVWGSFDEPGIIHDERAYLLQAEIFARGRWTAASPPLPAFFEQMHVFVEPALFAKYPPGHSLTLVPGVWLGLPGLIPALLTGFAGGMTYWIARRLANPWVALLTWWLWTTAWANLIWSTSYLSETTSTAMWLLAVWAAVRWLDSGRDHYLASVAGAVAWGFAARPLTMAALALPLAYVIVRRLVTRRAWRPLVAPVVVGGVILLIGPIWNQQTLGDWRRDPYPYYSQVYFPFDKPGFGFDTTPPLRPLPAEMVQVGESFREVHEQYVPSALPLELLARVAALLRWCMDGWRVILGVLVLGAIVHGTRVERFALGSALCLFLAYLVFAHPPMWVVYYLELLPILHFVAAREIGRILHKLAGIGDERGEWPAPMANAAIALTLLLVPFGIDDVTRIRRAVDDRNAFHRAARDAFERLGPGKSIVFVSYPPKHSPHLSVTRNEADLQSAHQWIVRDQGPLNARLLAVAPDRAAFSFDAGRFRAAALAPANGDDGGNGITRRNGATEDERRSSTVATEAAARR